MHKKASVSIGTGEVGALRALDLGEIRLVECTEEAAKGDLTAPCSYLERYKDDGVRLFKMPKSLAGATGCLVRFMLETRKSFSTREDGAAVDSPSSELFITQPGKALVDPILCWE